MNQGGPDKDGGDSGEGEPNQCSHGRLPKGTTRCHQVFPKYGQRPTSRQPQTAELVSLAASRAISLGNSEKSR